MKHELIQTTIGFCVVICIVLSMGKHKQRDCISGAVLALLAGHTIGQVLSWIAGML